MEEVTIKFKKYESGDEDYAILMWDKSLPIEFNNVQEALDYVEDARKNGRHNDYTIQAFIITKQEHKMVNSRCTIYFMPDGNKYISYFVSG